jgi:hypothetical protein
MDIHPLRVLIDSVIYGWSGQYDDPSYELFFPANALGTLADNDRSTDEGLDRPTPPANSFPAARWVDHR